MRCFTRCGRVLVAGIATVAAAGSLTQAAQAAPAPPAVPGDIAVPAGHEMFLLGHAIGVQIYGCDATAAGFAWTFVAPRADLFDDHGKLVVTHFAGPTWQARDGSRFVGKVVAPVTVDPTAIPWLLLERAATSAGPDGDRLTGTTHVQRIATRGGLAPPAADCNAVTVGARAEVPYTADYTFWKQTGGDES